MNNSKSVELAFGDGSEDKSIMPDLERRQKELFEILEAIGGLKNTHYYKNFKILVLDDELQKAKESLLTATDPIQIYKLQGFVSSQTFSDLARLESYYKSELEQVKGRIKENEEEK